MPFIMFGTTLMSLQSTAVATITMRIRGFDTTTALVTVDIAPTILAGARVTRVAVLVGDVSPRLATVAVMVLWRGELHTGQGDVSEEPDRAALLPGLLRVPILDMVTVAHPVVTHHHARLTGHHLPLHEVRVHPYC